MGLKRNSYLESCGTSQDDMTDDVIIAENVKLSTTFDYFLFFFLPLNQTHKATNAAVFQQNKIKKNKKNFFFSMQTVVQTDTKA